MIKDKNIFIRNVYYMLAYAFHELKKNNYASVEKEEFQYIHDMFAEILYRGVVSLLKQGLYREYIDKKENLPLLKGKLDMRGSISNRIQHKNLISCEFDELSENNILNQILKTTLSILLRAKDVNRVRKEHIKSVLPFFSDIDIIEPALIRWDLIKYQRNNQKYRTLLNICYFIIEEYLLSTTDGIYKAEAFVEKNMNKLFEKFVLEYFRHHYPYFRTNADQVLWDINKDDSPMIDFLPTMQTDITLSHKGKTLIIDTKYYSHMLQSQFGRSSIHSGNLYQIFTYVKNRDVGHTGNVIGMLLYARTDELIAPKLDVNLGGNRFLVDSLDLSVDFEAIKNQLNKIANIIT